MEDESTSDDTTEMQLARVLTQFTSFIDAAEYINQVHEQLELDFDKLVVALVNRQIRIRMALVSVS